MEGDMPTPGKDEKEKDFISRCIPIVLKEGTAKDNKQAAAVCYSMWREHKKEEGKSADGLAIKTLREENGGVVVGGPLLLWGSAGKKDLQGEYFTPETELWLDTYKGAPALFHHGLDDTIGLAVIGHRVKTEVRDSGVWVEDWLNTSSKYWAWVKPLLEAEKLYYSPGSAPHLVKRAQDGRLLSFPVVEDTLTPIPAQHRLLPVEQVKAAYKAAGLDLPDMPEPDAALRGPGEGDGGPSRLAVARAKAKAEATLLNIRILEGQ
jgi:hypothetical protein